MLLFLQITSLFKKKHINQVTLREEAGSID